MSIDFLLGLVVGLEIAKFMIVGAFFLARGQARRAIRKSLDEYEIKERKKRGL